MILVIDDDRDFAASLSALLQSEGYDVRIATSGKAGLTALDAAEPVLIVCDVMMENATEGYSVSGAMHMREMEGKAHIPFIMVSSIHSSPDELFPRSEEVSAIRPDYYFTKPLDIPRFLEIVRRTVRTVRA